MKLNSIMFYLCAGLCSSAVINNAFSMDGENIPARSFRNEKGKLGPYHMMIVSKYFESINDFKNLEFTTSKAYKNADKWHMNPISIKPYQLRYFPNLETLNLYTQRDVDTWIEHSGNTEQIQKIEVWKQYKDTDANSEYLRLKLLLEHDVCSITGATFHDVILTRASALGTFDESGKYTFNNDVYTDGDLKNARFVIKMIDNNAFSRDTKLTSITIPDSVQRLSGRAFSGCTGLKSIVIPGNIRCISCNAFEGCTGLTFVTIKNGVRYISESAFHKCVNLESVVIPDSVEVIVDNAFYGCIGLRYITIPNSILSIGNHAFEGCTNAIFTVASQEMKNYLNSVHQIHNDRIFLDRSFDKDEHKWRWPNNASIQIPAKMTSIDNNMFNNRTDITSIRIPNSVQSIGDSVFDRCIGLTSIEIPYKVTSIGEFAIANCSRLSSLHIPNSVQSIGICAFENCVKLKSITLPNRITELEGFMFSGCSSLTSIKIPSSVKRINLKSFEGCIGLKSIEIPYGVTQIASSVFKGCTGLSSIKLPNSVSSIFKRAFEGCIGLTSITIPQSVKSIDRDAFIGCTGLRQIYVYSDSIKQQLIGNEPVSYTIEVLNVVNDEGK